MAAKITKELLDKIHLIDLIGFIEREYKVVFNSIGPTTATAKCPHPDHNDKKPSFSAWKDKKGIWSWCCHACHCGTHDYSSSKKNYGQDAIAFVRWMSDYKGSKHIYTFYEAVSIVAKYIGYDIPSNDIKHSSKEYDDRLKINMAVATGCCRALISNKNSEAYQYLISRGLEEEDIINWKIGFNGSRILYPFTDHKDDVIGFTMRLIKENSYSSKYINSKNSDIFNKSSYLYGIHRIDTDKKYVIITEGQMDVIMATKYGLDNVVATSGTNFTDKHCELIKDIFGTTPELIFIYDDDAAGKHGVEKAAKIARSNGFIPEIFELKDNKDLCDFALEVKDNISDIVLNNAVPYFYEELKNDVAKFDTIVLNFQSKISPKIHSIYSNIKNEHERDIFSSFVNSKFNIKTGGGEKNDHKETFIETG